MEAKYLEIGGRTFYAFEEPDVIGPMLLKGSVDEAAPLSIAGYNAVETGFWRRQFGRTATPGQRKFDWYFGFLFPLVCLYFDPFVFRDWFGGAGMLSGFQPLAYVLSSASILGMAAWLLWGEKLGRVSALLAGLFIAAAVISLMVGLILLPISLIGALALIGFLGFTPLLTSIVFLRNGMRAMRVGRRFFDGRTLGYLVALSSLLCLVVGWLVNQAVTGTTRPSIELFP